MDITEKWLAEIGGWAAMKAARSLVQAGAVADAERAGDLIQGTVGAGKTKYRAGLKIAGKSDVRNLCTCPASRGRGVICEHSLAVALAAIAPPAQAAKPAPVGAAPTGGARPASAGAQPAAVASGRFEVFLPESLFEGGGTSGARPLARHSVFLRHVPQAEELQPGSAAAAAHGRLARWLAKQGIPAVTTPLALDSAAVTGLLAALGDHPRVFLGRPGKAEPTPLAVMAEPTRLPVVFEELPGQPDALVACGKRSEQIVGLRISPPGAGQGGWFFCRETATVFVTPPVASPPCAALITELAAAPASEPRTAAWLVEHREALDEFLQITLEGPALSRLHVLPVPCEIELSLDGSLQAVVARLEARFGHFCWPLVPDRHSSHISGNRFPLQNESVKSIFYTQNIGLEMRAIEELEALGFVPQGNSEWVLTGRAAVLRFYGSELPRLRRTLRVHEGDRWRASTRQLGRIAPRIELDRSPSGGGEAGSRESRDWLAFEIAYVAPDGFRLPRADVMRMIRSGNRSAQGPGGIEYVLDADDCSDLEESLRDIQVEMTATGGKSTADHLQHLENWCDYNSVKTFADNLISTDRLRFLLSDLAPLLRGYQEAGIRWLEARLRSGGGALLADDMGLGKTLQAVACLRLLRSQSDGHGPTLILCPKTLLENWRSEMERFSPSFRVVVWAGSGRFRQQKELYACDVILSSYSLAHKDLDIFRKLSLSALILDEASFIRNPDTDAARAVFELRPARRLALTGTPIENSVADLWSIMQFLAPGYLGSRKAFRERFEKPFLEVASMDAKAETKRPAERLRRLVRRFYLRRTKQEVLPELPEKIEEVQWCELSRPQMEVYRRLLEEGREEVRQAGRRAGAGTARLTMFTVLLRLRQVCCDLRLAGLPEQVIRGLEPEEISGKMMSLRELLQMRATDGGKILIFSQFTKFLFQIREALLEMGIGHSYLDGRSEDRAEQVRAFKSEPGRRVFLISLKAGGYGLNLAEADQVILMDPWWNPAVEAQAIDRAHRFGQERVVTATRMIARGTLEEKILKLQQAKRGLVGSVIESEGSDAGGLTADEMEELLN